MGIMPDAFLGPVIIMVICCAVFTPIMLKVVFKPKAGEAAYGDLAQSALAERYEEAEQLEEISDQLLSENRALQTTSQEEKKRKK